MTAVDHELEAEKAEYKRDESAAQYLAKLERLYQDALQALSATQGELLKLRISAAKSGRTVGEQKPNTDALYDAIGDCLLGHKMLYHVQSEDRTLELVDVVTPSGDKDISRGSEELEHLRDEIVDVIATLFKSTGGES